MILAKATWTEVDALDREQVVVVPVGGTEQHGPHLPIGTATILAEALASKLEERLQSEVLLVPAIPFAVSGGEKAFAGTIDLGHELLSGTFRAIVTALARHRFRRFLFVVALTGDTSASVRLALRELKDVHPTMQFARIVAGGSPLKRGEVLLAIAPEFVRKLDDLPREAQPLPPRAYDSFVTDTDETSPNGFRLIRHEDVIANGEEYMPYQIDTAIELVRTMREGRVYVEEGEIGE